MDDFKSALVNAGYRCSAFHKDPAAIKTDAPNHVKQEGERLVEDRPQSEGRDNAVISETERDREREEGMARMCAQLYYKRSRFSRIRHCIREKLNGFTRVRFWTIPRWCGTSCGAGCRNIR